MIATRERLTNLSAAREIPPPGANLCHIVSRIALAALFAMVSLYGTACEDVNGGAVEFAWELRSQAGYALKNCACADPPVGHMRLSLTPVEGQAGLPGQVYDFACQRQRASTAFEVPPGRYEMRVVAVDTQGEVAAGIVTPPPQVKTVVWGQPASLDAQLVVAPCAASCANKNGSCSAQ